MDHICRKGGKPIGAREGLGWAAPGEVVKLADEDRWGRIETLWRCCHSYDVRVAPYGDDEGGLYILAPEALEDAYDAYPANLPPGGDPIPVPYPGKGARSFPGAAGRRDS